MNATKRKVERVEKKIVNGHTHRKCVRCQLFKPMVALWEIGDKEIAACLGCLDYVAESGAITSPFHGGK